MPSEGLVELLENAVEERDAGQARGAIQSYSSPEPYSMLALACACATDASDERNARNLTNYH